MQRYWRKGAVEFYITYLSLRQLRHIKKLWGDNPLTYEMAIVEHGFNSKALQDGEFQYTPQQLREFEKEIDCEISEAIKKDNEVKNGHRIQNR